MKIDEIDNRPINSGNTNQLKPTSNNESTSEGLPIVKPSSEGITNERTPQELPRVTQSSSNGSALASNLNDPRQQPLGGAVSFLQVFEEHSDTNSTSTNPKDDVAQKIVKFKKSTQYNAKLLLSIGSTKANIANDWHGHGVTINNLTDAHHKLGKSILFAVWEAATDSQRLQMQQTLLLDTDSDSTSLARLASNLFSPMADDGKIAKGDKRIDDPNHQQESNGFNKKQLNKLKKQLKKQLHKDLTKADKIPDEKTKKEKIAEAKKTHEEAMEKLSENDKTASPEGKEARSNKRESYMDAISLDLKIPKAKKITRETTVRSDLLGDVADIVLHWIESNPKDINASNEDSPNLSLSSFGDKDGQPHIDLIIDKLLLSEQYHYLLEEKPEDPSYSTNPILIKQGNSTERPYKKKLVDPDSQSKIDDVEKKMLANGFTLKRIQVLARDKVARKLMKEMDKNDTMAKNAESKQQINELIEKEINNLHKFYKLSDRVPPKEIIDDFINNNKDEQLVDLVNKTHSKKSDFSVALDLLKSRFNTDMFSKNPRKRYINSEGNNVKRTAAKELIFDAMKARVDTLEKLKKLDNKTESEDKKAISEINKLIKILPGLNAVYAFIQPLLKNDTTKVAEADTAEDYVKDYDKDNAEDYDKVMELFDIAIASISKNQEK